MKFLIIFLTFSTYKLAHILSVNSYVFNRDVLDAQTVKEIHACDECIDKSSSCRALKRKEKKYCVSSMSEVFYEFTLHTLSFL